MTKLAQILQPHQCQSRVIHVHVLHACEWDASCKEGEQGSHGPDEWHERVQHSLLRGQADERPARKACESRVQ